MASPGLELSDAILLLAILQANVAQITADRALQARYAALDALPEDSLRRPISVSALAASRGLPFETVRRRLGRLAREGLCEVTERGYRVPGEVLRRPQFADGPVRIQDLVQGLAAALAEAGRQPPMILVDAPAQPRVVARIATDYVLRMLSLLVDRVGDPVDGFLLLALFDAAPAPASAADVARRLCLTHETARRRLWALARRGLCARGRRGWVLRRASLDTLRLEEAMLANIAHLRLMFSSLTRLGAMAPAARA